MHGCRRCGSNSSTLRSRSPVATPRTVLRRLLPPTTSLAFSCRCPLLNGVFQLPASALPRPEHHNRLLPILRFFLFRVSAPAPPFVFAFPHCSGLGHFREPWSSPRSTPPRAGNGQRCLGSSSPWREGPCPRGPAQFGPRDVLARPFASACLGFVQAFRALRCRLCVLAVLFEDYAIVLVRAAVEHAPGSVGLEESGRGVDPRYVVSLFSHRFILDRVSSTPSD